MYVCKLKFVLQKQTSTHACAKELLACMKNGLKFSSASLNSRKVSDWLTNLRITKGGLHSRSCKRVHENKTWWCFGSKILAECSLTSMISCAKIERSLYNGRMNAYPAVHDARATARAAAEAIWKRILAAIAYPTRPLRWNVLPKKHYVSVNWQHRYIHSIAALLKVWTKIWR